MRRPLLFVILVAGLMLGPGSADAQIVVNGSFEEGGGANIPDWGHCGSVFLSVTDLFDPLPDGDKAMGFNGGQQPPNGIVSQALPTVPGETYTVTFDWGAYSNTHPGTPQSLRAEATGASLLGAIDVSDPASNPATYDRHSFEFVADGPITLLAFSDTSTATFNVDGVLDRVLVSGPPAAPVEVLHVCAQYSDPSVILGSVSHGLSTLPATFLASFALLGHTSMQNVSAGLPDVAGASIRFGDGLWPNDLTSFSLETDANSEVITLSYTTAPLPTPTVTASEVLNASFSATIQGTDSTSQGFQYVYGSSVQTLTVQAAVFVPMLAPWGLLLLACLLGAAALLTTRRFRRPPSRDL